MGKFDISFKDLIAGVEKDLLMIVGFKVEELQVLNVEFQSVRERRVDIIYKCAVGSYRFLSQVEIQLYYEKNFPIRMLGYWCDVKLKFPEYPLIQIVLTCGKNVKDSLDEEIKIEGLGGQEIFSYVRSKYIVIDLCEIPFERFLSFDNPNINAFGILSKDCDVGKLLQRIIDYKLAEEQTASLITKIYILSKLAKRDKEVEKFMQETQKIDLMEYDLFREAIERGIKEGREKGLKEGREKGLKEGREKGLKEGREKGIKEGLIKGLELAIQARFGARSRKLISKLRNIEDVQKLKQIVNKFRKIRTVRELGKILEGT
ncbi:MAG: hypothetical protein N2254_04935 [bacterium]|nr:hypothetical protein [bacterium]